jgi:predicted ATPase
MIDYIEIKGFKSIKKMELELKPINILIGSNGSGKSNFISFFKMLNSILNTNFQKYVIEEKVDNILHFGRKTTKILNSKVRLTSIEDQRDFLQFEINQTQNGGLFFSKIGTGVLLSNNFLIGTFNLNEGLFSEKFEDNYIYTTFSNLQVYHFNDTTNTSFLRKESELNDNRYLIQDGRNLPSYLYFIKEKHPKYFERILKTIQSIAPYISDFILEPSKLNEKEIELRWKDTGDSESNFSAYQFSDGTLRFIALTVLLMQPDPPKTIIIDEPELGLHPFAISKLAAMIQIASTKSQIIISTQSPGLISHFTAEDIIIVDKSIQENQSIFKRLNTEHLKVWLDEFTTLGDLWETNQINGAQPFNNL